MLNEKIYIACDHAGFEIKEYIKKILADKGYEVLDLGTHSNERTDYPDYAKSLCESITPHNPQTKGILICGSGIGMSIAANRYTHIRAALCKDSQMAELSRAHNDANVLCLGARITAKDKLSGILNAFLTTEFEGGRHIDRIKKLHTKD